VLTGKRVATPPVQMSCTAYADHWIWESECVSKQLQNTD